MPTARETRNIEDWIAAAIKRGDIVSPCLVFDFDAVDRTLELFEKYLAGVKLYYSLKANDDPALLSYLNARGVGFDVASMNEIHAALQVGAESEQLILSNTIKSPACIREMFKRRVAATTVDNENDLEAIAREATFHSHHPRILVRVKLPALGVDINLNEKFGCSMEVAASLLNRAYELGLPADGIHFHVGTQCKNPDSYLAGLQIAMHILRDLKDVMDLDLKTIDIGGGFPDEIAAEECGGLERFFAELSEFVKGAQDEGFNVIAEPGRVIASGAGIAVSQVIGRNVHEDRDWLYLDDGIYGLYSTAHYEKRKFNFIPIGKSPIDLVSYVIAGPTCDSLDVIGNDVMLPRNINTCDYLLAYQAGAYSISVKSNFNGMGQISTMVSQHALIQPDFLSSAKLVSGG